jgi:NNMT/PNMT/TEMT family
MADHEPGVPNDAALWSKFDADGYWKNNYAALFPEDEEIIRFASAFLIEACAGRPAAREAVDIGSGTNLYPALLLMPWARRIVLTDYAETNIDWLVSNLPDAPGEWVWQPFWNLVADLPGYRDVDRPRRHLASAHEVRRLSVFDLPARAWDLGTMFFVADGMTTDEAEFEAAVRAFLGALTAGAPFLMAFMAGSEGYDVSGIKFPSVRLTDVSLAALVSRLPVSRARFLRTDNTVRPLRPGYDAMILITGYVTDDEADGA